ncbi:MAG TPA: hypothetical protein VHF22_01275 [Planctomycetota bacterium]|nr:hypothetical protein [Planctomycetota bacterium]
MVFSARRSPWFPAFLALISLALPLLVIAAEVKDAEEDLKKAINASDLDAADRAIAKLRDAGGTAAEKALVGLAQKIPAGSEATYWRLVNGAAGFRDDAGLEELAKTILDSKNSAIARDLMFALGNNRAPKVAQLVYAPILEKGSEEFRLMAAENLPGIEFVESVDVMLVAFRKEEKRDKKGEIANRLRQGITFLTGATVDSADAFEAWWKGGGRSQGLKGRQKREENTGTVVDDNPFVDVQSLERLPKERIVVFVAKCKKGGGNFDDMGKLLDQMKIPHTVVDKAELDAGKFSLAKAMAVLNTCTQINDHCVCPKCSASNTGAGNRMVNDAGCEKHPGGHHKDNKDDNEGHKFTPGAAKQIRDWCERGGYLFTEDWSLTDITEDWVYQPDKMSYKHNETSWSKFVKGGKMMKQRTVPCAPARGHTSHPLLRGVFIDPSLKPTEEPAGGEGGGGDGGDGGTVLRAPPMPQKIERTWTIDDDSPYIEVVDRQRVTTLMESEVLAKEGNGAVAITFLPAGGGEAAAAAGHPEKLVGGRVLHVLSHFGKQQNREDEFALQSLLLNFLMEANRRYKGK